MSERCEAFRVSDVERVPGLDNLGLVRFYGYECLVPLRDFKSGDLAVYIPPDFVVPDKPEYGFLDGHFRIKARRFRKVWSQGLVVAAPTGVAEGEDVTELMGIKKYVAPVNRREAPKGPKVTRYFNIAKKYANSFEAGPPEPGPYYDIENWMRYPGLFQDGELVEISEKIHGTNARFTYQAGRLWVASRSGFRRSKSNMKWWERALARLTRPRFDPESIYWQAVDQNPWISDLCKALEGIVYYGEIYGPTVQELAYGLEGGALGLRLFDAYDTFTNSFISRCYGPLTAHLTEAAPVLYTGPYSEDIVRQYISGPSKIPSANHYREGIVIKPLMERVAPHFGRVILKAVSPEYLSKVKDS